MMILSRPIIMKACPTFAATYPQFAAKRTIEVIGRKGKQAC